MNEIEIKKVIKSMYPNIEQDTLQHILGSASYIKKTKGTILIRSGERHRYFYLIVKGCAKTYYQKNSKQVCTWFAFKNDIVATLSNVAQGKPSTETIELIENSELIQFETKSIRDLAESNLSASHFMNELITEHATFLEARLYSLQFMSSKERYEALINHAPEISQKVSVTDIASFLGVSRETVSRIRSMK